MEWAEWRERPWWNPLVVGCWLLVVGLVVAGGQEAVKRLGSRTWAARMRERAKRMVMIDQLIQLFQGRLTQRSPSRARSLSRSWRKMMADGRTRPAKTCTLTMTSCSGRWGTSTMPAAAKTQIA